MQMTIAIQFWMNLIQQNQVPAQSTNQVPAVPVQALAVPVPAVPVQAPAVPVPHLVIPVEVLLQEDLLVDPVEVLLQEDLLEAVHLEVPVILQATY